MTDAIIVGDVYTANDCASRRCVSVTSHDQERLLPFQFKMSRNYMRPEAKIALASVLPGDTVGVRLNELSDDPMILGYYSDILSAGSFRFGSCECGTSFTSDGYHVYCPNSNCPMTLTTRLRRLANTEFFRHRPYNKTFCGYLVGDINHNHPFRGLIDPQFWTGYHQSLESTVMGIKQPISLATFMIESEFRDFIDSSYQINVYKEAELEQISHFYRAMETFSSQRDQLSETQNYFAHEFLWSLGLESVTDIIIDRLLSYEMCHEPSNPLVAYSYALTHPYAFAKEMGLHYLEAEAILQEVTKRKHELFDIFACYTSVGMMEDVFGDVLR